MEDKTDRSLLDIGEFVRNLRKGQGMSQMELAEQMGVEHNTVSNLENGKNPMLRTLLLALAVLGANISEIPSEKPSVASEDDRIHQILLDLRGLPLEQREVLLNMLKSGIQSFLKQKKE